jgi:hypothetical protein
VADEEAGDVTVSVEVRSPRRKGGPFGGGWTFKAAVMLSRTALRIEFFVVALMVEFERG